MIGIGVAALLVLVVFAVALYLGGVFGSGPEAAPSATSSSLSQFATATTPASAASPRAPASVSAQPPAKETTTTYSGEAFSVDYPAGWMVTSAEVHHSWGTDTTIVSPTNASTLLRVDVTPNSSASDPLSAAQPVISALSREPGYQQLDLTSSTFDGYSAEHWGFLVKEKGGELLHKEDLFFIDTTNGDGVAVLTQAPASQYSGLASRFASLRQSLSMN